jgi:hypothetical protein
LLAIFGLADGAAQARTRAAPHITSVRCWPPGACPNPHAAALGGTLRFTGRNLRSGMVVRFPRRRMSGVRARTVGSRLRAAGGFFLARVPWSAKSGRVVIVSRSGLLSNAAGPIRIKRKRPPPPAHASTTALDGTGMWIWYVSRSSGGDPIGIAAQAKRYGVRTVFVKSSDGTSWWNQFSPQLLSALKAAGLRVCAWQFVYGNRPTTEAALGVRAARTGADCLVIDAESQYEGKYAQAQTYTVALRNQVGVTYPIGLAGFPYVDYHPAFPYSVFLGPGRAQYNIPQVYWKAIGTTVDRAMAHTYLWNAAYGRQIFPLGQLYDRPSPSDVKRFRQLAVAYGAAGVSWWDWQEASAGGWAAIGASLPPVPPPLPPGFPLLKRGARGDLVVWAQQHLMSAGLSVSSNGSYDPRTEQGVRDFQTSSGLASTGQLDSATWAALLRFEPKTLDWTRGGAAVAAAGPPPGRNGPRSARLAAVRDEIHGKAH